jgi:hypothetical protein
MTKMIVEIPDPLHRLIKSLAGAKGESIKSLILRAIENVIKQEANINVKANNGDYITEEQADEMLKPVILKYISQINNGTFTGYTKEEFFKKLKK